MSIENPSEHIPQTQEAERVVGNIQELAREITDKVKNLSKSERRKSVELAAAYGEIAENVKALNKWGNVLVAFGAGYSAVGVGAGAAIESLSRELDTVISDAGFMATYCIAALAAIKSVSSVCSFLYEKIEKHSAKNEIHG